MSTSGDGGQPPVAIVFKGQGKLRQHMLDELEAASGGLHIMWQKRAWCDIQVMIEYMKTVLAPWAKEHEDPLVDDEHKLLVLDHCGRTHNAPAVRTAIRQAGFLPFFLEPGMTHRLQPVDAGIGKSLPAHVRNT